jgi:acetyl esterase
MSQLPSRELRYNPTSLMAGLVEPEGRAIQGGSTTMPITVETVCYVKHGNREIMARIFKPEGAGPFPCYVDLHGGAWNNGDLDDRTSLGEYLAERGVVMVTLNFRHGADGYPTTLQDINYGVRWAKAHAKDLKIDPGKVALGGASSGGHLAMLAAMRPNDPRYSAIPGPAGVDAGVQGVVMLWPVINPLSRYRYAIRRSQEANPPAFSIGMKEKHDTYWHTEAAMSDGNPMLILERGEKGVALPPAIWIQGRPDEVHDYHDPEGGFPGNEPERFISNYRKAGGDIEITYFDNAKRNTETSHAPVLAFLKKHL